MIFKDAMSTTAVYLQLKGKKVEGRRTRKLLKKGG
jgi:hypothetical protein